MALTDPTFHLRKQIADLTLRITREPNIRKADELRRRVRPLEKELSRIVNRYKPVREQEEAHHRLGRVDNGDLEPCGNFEDAPDVM